MQPSDDPAGKPSSDHIPTPSPVPDPTPLMEGRRHRTFSGPAPRGRLRDTDSAARLQAIKAGGWSVAGVIMGGFFGVLSGLPLLGIVIASLLGGAVIFGTTMLVVSGAGRIGSTLYNPSGSRTPGKREYSLAESFAAQGRYEDAVSAFQLAVGEHPEDPVPYLRIARIYRDEMSDPEQAERWFKRAQRDAVLGQGQMVLVVRELVELYYKVGTPAKAAPVLARAVEELAGRPEQAWARQELAEVKQIIAEGEA